MFGKKNMLETCQAELKKVVRVLEKKKTKPVSLKNTCENDSEQGLGVLQV